MERALQRNGRIVKKSFSTPTSLGGYFRRLAEETDRREYKVKTLQEELAINHIRNKRLRKWFIFVVLVLLIIVVTMAVTLYTGRLTLLPK